MGKVRVVITLAAIAALVIITIGLVHAQSMDTRLRRVEDRLDLVRDEQLRRSSRFDHVEQRLATLEAHRIEARLTRLEAFAETSRTILIGVAIAVAAQTVEMLSRTLRRKNPNGGRA